MENIALHMLDIVQNSIEANASRIYIEIEKDTTKQKLCITISDNGRGMNKEEIAKVLDPFYTSRTTRKVGMGLSLLKQQVDQTGGCLQIISEQNKGTSTKFCFNLSHIDCPPMGNFEDSISTFITVNPDIELILKVSCATKTFLFESKKFLEIFEGLPLTQSELRKYLYDFLSENMSWIYLTECTI
ncbi:MAG: ATP-binding protein [Bacteroidales bacterium]|nr:ATP-binding protein [Bacteroidales bacterium]